MLENRGKNLDRVNYWRKFRQVNSDVLDEKYVVGICTTGSRETLDKFLQIFEPELDLHPENIRIVIAINGPGSYEPVITKNVTVVRELRKGIAYARNRVLQELQPDENLIFIDDDEYPDESWFKNLLASHRKYPNALITGPVREVTAAGQVVVDSKLRPISEIADGSLRPRAATNNLLIPATVLKNGLVYFDLFFNGGGSDADLTMSLRNQGYEIRWAANAVLYEIEDNERNDPEWNFRRDCRNAAIYPLIIKRNSRMPYLLLYTFKKAMQLAIYSVIGLTGGSRKRQYVLHKIGFQSLITGRQIYHHD